jgi:hypothetical protein
MFLMPKRKLSARLRIEQMTGRAQEDTRSDRDILERMAVSILLKLL